jgi:RimJ/RimL family protein N-acetyltransferase
MTSDDGQIRTTRLVITPMTLTDSADLFEILRDPAIGDKIDEVPPTSVEEVRTRIASWDHGPGEDRDERWLNWLARTPAGEPVAHLSVTVTPGGAWLAWIVHVGQQRRGYATEGARAVMDALTDNGIRTFLASIPEGHMASEGVAKGLGMRLTGDLADGERVWRLDIDG